MGTLNSLNGYIAQGIDNNWVLNTIPIAFDHVRGNNKCINIKVSILRFFSYLKVDTLF